MEEQNKFPEIAAYGNGIVDGVKIGVDAKRCTYLGANPPEEGVPIIIFMSWERSGHRVKEATYDLVESYRSYDGTHYDETEVTFWLYPHYPPIEENAS